MMRLILCSIAALTSLTAASDRNWRAGVLTECKVETSSNPNELHADGWQGSSNNSVIFLPSNRVREFCTIQSAGEEFPVARTLQAGSRGKLRNGANIRFTVKGKRVIVADAKGDEHKLQLVENVQP